jgi:ABC-type uncharacterized transport system permease subunit
MATVLVHIALIAYTGGAAVYLVWLLRPRDRFVAAGRILLLGGLLLHLSSFAAAHGGGSEGFFEWRGGQLFSLLSAAIVLVYLALDLRYRLPVAGSVVAPLVVAAMIPAHLVPSRARAVAPALTHSLLLPLHIGAATLGTAALGLAFALALLYLAGERQLKTKSTGRLFARLPSLELVDRLGYQLSVWGFIFLSAAIATGSFAAKESTGFALPIAAKELFAMLAWVLLAALIQARLVAGWRGRRVALIVVAGFLLIIGTYAGLLAGAPVHSGPPSSILLPHGDHAARFGSPAARAALLHDRGGR